MLFLKIHDLLQQFFFLLFEAILRHWILVALLLHESVYSDDVEMLLESIPLNRRKDASGASWIRRQPVLVVAGLRDKARQGLNRRLRQQGHIVPHDPVDVLLRHHIGMGVG